MEDAVVVVPTETKPTATICNSMSHSFVNGVTVVVARLLPKIMSFLVWYTGCIINDHIFRHENTRKQQLLFYFFFNFTNSLIWASSGFNPFVDQTISGVFF